MVSGGRSLEGQKLPERSKVVPGMCFGVPGGVLGVPGGVLDLGGQIGCYPTILFKSAKLGFLQVKGRLNTNNCSKRMLFFM